MLRKVNNNLQINWVHRPGFQCIHNSGGMSKKKDSLAIEELLIPTPIPS